MRIVYSPAYESAPERVPEWTGLKSRAHSVLLVCFLLLTFVGTHPYDDPSAGARAEGNILDRFAVIGMFLLAGWLAWRDRRVTLGAIARNWLHFMLVGICAVSILWSDYPDLTLRRAMLLGFLTVIAMVIANGVVDLRRFHTFLFGFLTAIILFNLIGLVVAPSLSNSDIGVKGMYTQKNVAGIVAMLAMLTGVTWIVGARGWRPVLYAILALAPALFFLILTRSKTSINLAFAGMAIVLYFALAEKLGPRFILATAIAALVACAGVLSVLTWYEFDGDFVLGKLVGDSTFSGRDELWAFARAEAEKRYWLGHGYGAFWDVGAFNDPLTRAEQGTWLASVQIGIINQAHHGYLELWLHVGRPVAGLAAIMVILGVLKGGIPAAFGNGDRQSRAALGCLAVIALVHLIHNFTEATLMMRGSLFWNTMTMILFLISRTREFLPARTA